MDFGYELRFTILNTELNFLDAGFFLLLFQTTCIY